MKNQNHFPIVAVAVGFAALSLICGCSKSDDGVTTIESQRADGSKAEVVVNDSNVTVSVTDSWDRMKDFTYDRRADLAAGIDRLAKDTDRKVDMYRPKAAGTSENLQADRDSAMKGYDDARADLKAKRADLDNATADTWESAKAKSGQSWQNTKAAYDKVAQLNGGT
jgi:hypothetical protein